MKLQEEMIKREDLLRGGGIIEEEDEEDGDIGEDEKKLKKEMLEERKKGNNQDLMREAGVALVSSGMPSHLLTGGPGAYGYGGMSAHD